METIKSIAYGSKEYMETLALRNKVMRIPLGLDIYQEDMSAEASSVLIGYFEDEKLIGVGVMSNDGDIYKIEYLCVDSDIQSHGVGGKLLEQLEKTAAKQLGKKIIRKTANEIYFGMNLGESELSIDKDDLEQEGCIGLLDAIPRFDSSKGTKFLTYAAPSIRNAMTDLIRDAFSQYEQRMTDTTDGLAFQKIRLDEVVPGEERLLRIEAIADPIVKSPEQIYVEQEILRELYEGLDRIGSREQAYLLYRYGFTDDVEHTMVGTAIHFNLRESRAKKIEEDAIDNLWLELPWWF